MRFFNSLQFWNAHIKILATAKLTGLNYLYHLVLISSLHEKFGDNRLTHSIPRTIGSTKPRCCPWFQKVVYPSHFIAKIYPFFPILVYYAATSSYCANHFGALANALSHNSTTLYIAFLPRNINSGMKKCHLKIRMHAHQRVPILLPK